jgi:hypothetical protein
MQKYWMVDEEFISEIFMESFSVQIKDNSIDRKEEETRT